MINSTITQKEWDIPSELKRKFNTQTLKRFLQVLNNLNGGNYFFVDEYRKEIIVDAKYSQILREYPKESIQKEGLRFFNKILKDKDLKWLKHLRKPVMDVFFSLDEEERQNLMLLYDIPVLQANGKKQILHCKIVPFQSCENGNLWLALGCISPSITNGENRDVCIINKQSMTRYNLIRNQFAAQKILPFTPLEKEILWLLVKNMLETDICVMLNINKNKYQRTRKTLFEKLEVNTNASAIQRAHHIGLFE